MKKSMIELIEKFKKNSKLNIADKEVFEKELNNELATGEFTEDVETILCVGPIDITMKALAVFLASTDKQVANQFINKFLYSKKIQENKGGASGMRLVPLFMYLIDVYNEESKIVHTAFYSMVRFAYKNGKTETNKKVVELIRTVMLPVFLKKDVIVNLSFVNDKKWPSIRDLFIETITEGKELNYEIIQRVYYWLKAAGKDMGTYTEEYCLNKVITSDNPVQDNENDLVETEIINDNHNEATNKKNSEKNDTTITVEDIIKTLVPIVIGEYSDINNIKNSLRSTNQKVDDLQALLGRLQLREKQQVEIIQELSVEKATLQNANVQYADKIKQLEEMTQNLQLEVNDRKQFTDTITRNRERQSEEHLNKLASKLRIDYRDYCDAKGIEMSIDLGENMREQLGVVFSILEKSGIKLN